MAPRSASGQAGASSAITTASAPAITTSTALSARKTSRPIPSASGVVIPGALEFEWSLDCRDPEHEAEPEERERDRDDLFGAMHLVAHAHGPCRDRAHASAWDQEESVGGDLMLALAEPQPSGALEHLLTYE